MKDELYRFSLSDFLAYLFPGAITLVATAGLIRLSRFDYLLSEIQLNLVTGIILIGCAYFVGATLSSLMVIIEPRLFRYFRLSNPTDRIALTGFEDQVMKAFNQIFDDHGPWSSEHFYLARTFVCEWMPNCAVTIERQASLRQIRRNSILPVLLLGLVGIVAGMDLLSLQSSQRPLGGLVVAASMLGSYVIARSLITNGMYLNRKREVREVCCGLLSYHCTDPKPLRAGR